jgi:hypothetical protein
MTAGTVLESEMPRAEDAAELLEALLQHPAWSDVMAALPPEVFERVCAWTDHRVIWPCEGPYAH